MGSFDRLHVRTLTFALLLAASGCQLPQLAPTLLSHWKGSLERKTTTDDTAIEIPLTEFARDVPPDSPVDPVAQKNGILLAQARLMEADGDTAQAIRTYQDILENDPDNLHSMRRLAILHASRGDLEIAEETFRNALSSDPRNARVLSDFGYFCYLQRRWDLAEEHLLHALECDPKLREARFNLGLLHARQGDSQIALQQFQDAGCTVADSYNNLAVARLLETDFEGARDAYDAALRADPDNTDSVEGIERLKRLQLDVSGDRRLSIRQ